jgi:hypothetical protein
LRHPGEFPKQDCDYTDKTTKKAMKTKGWRVFGRL